MADIAIILDNQANNVYAQNSREFLVAPIYVSTMRVLLSSQAQLLNTIKIRNSLSVGTESNRDISLTNYVSASTSKTNLILDIDLNPPVKLDGQTYFQTDIEPQSEIDLLFYFDQEFREDSMK